MAESTVPAQTASPSRGARYLTNVTWIWLGAVTNLFIGLFLTPYIIRKLGPAGYGVWTTLFSLVAYYGFLDFGFRPAVVRFSAYYRASNQPDRINEILNTLLAYYTAGSLLLVCVACAIAYNLESLVPTITAEYRSDVGILLILTSVTWVFGTNVFGGVMEGLQQFERNTHISVGCQVLRTAGAVVVLSLGFRLVALGLNLLMAQIVGVILGYIFVKKAFPELRFGRKYIKVSALKEVVGYGSHSFAAHMASTTLEQSSALGIVKFLPIEFTGFYGLPTKLLQYTSDIISRGAVVTQTNAAELSAKGEKQALGKLGIYANRYSLLLFMPLSIFLLVFGMELIRVYAGPAFVTWSGPLMPLFVISTTFAIAGQYNSTNVLFGLAKHQRYAYSLIAEAILFIGGMYLALQQGYGIYGVAWVSAVLMVVNRGLYTGWLVCQAVEISFFSYMREIYLKAVLVALAVGGAAYWAKLHFLPGKGWPQLIAAGVSIGIVYSGLAFLTCVEPHHRDTLLGWAKRKLPFLAKAAA